MQSNQISPKILFNNINFFFIKHNLCSNLLWDITFIPEDGKVRALTFEFTSAELMRTRMKEEYVAYNGMKLMREVLVPVFKFCYVMSNVGTESGRVEEKVGSVELVGVSTNMTVFKEAASFLWGAREDKEKRVNDYY